MNWLKEKCSIPLLPIIFILIALALSWQAIPYFQQQKHETLTSVQNLSYPAGLPEEIPIDLRIKFTTKDAFMANNPIDAEVQTTHPIKGVDWVQLTFVGAGSYFQQENKPTQDFSQREEISKNIVSLEKTISPSGIERFHGEKSGLIYGMGGDFDIGITLSSENGNVVGYGVGDDRYVFQNAIYIAPPETAISLRSNNLVIGLAWLAIAVAFLIPGLLGLVTTLKQSPPYH